MKKWKLIAFSRRINTNCDEIKNTMKHEKMVEVKRNNNIQTHVTITNHKKQLTIIVGCLIRFLRVYQIRTIIIFSRLFCKFVCDHIPT